MSESAVPQQLIVQVSDPHIGYRSEVRDPERALAAAVAEILTLKPLPVAVILSGDLTNDGASEQYRRLRELLAPLPIPVHPLVGNHDERAALRAAFADHPALAGGSEGDYVQYSADCGSIRLIACDSLDPGSDGGALGPERLAWIEAELAAADGAPAILAIHHPPIATGIAGFDEIGLPDPDRLELERILAGAEGVLRVVAGHAHRAIFGAFAGVPAVVCPSVHLPACLDLSGGTEIRLVDEPPALAVHVRVPTGELLTHIHPVEPGTPVPRLPKPG